jgi:hypothetical protein
MIWIPGHCEIDGNERADLEAKRAATDPALNRPYNHKPLKSARARVINGNAKSQWQNEWNESTKTASALRSITKRRGVKTGIKTIQRDIKPADNSHAGAPPHRALWPETASASYRHRGITLLRVQTRQRNGGTLPAGVPEVREAKKHATERGGNRRNES